MGQVMVEARVEYVDSVKIGDEIITARFLPGINPVDESLIDALKKKNKTKTQKSNFERAMMSTPDPLKRPNMPPAPPILRVLRQSEARAKEDGEMLFDHELHPKAPLQFATELQAKTGDSELAIASAKYALAVADARERLPFDQVEGAEVLAETAKKSDAKGKK